MLSMQFIREQEALVREALANRRSEAPIDRILDLDARRRSGLQELENLRAQRNQLSSRISGTEDPANRQQIIDQKRQISSRITELEPEMPKIESERNALRPE